MNDVDMPNGLGGTHRWGYAPSVLGGDPPDGRAVLASISPGQALMLFCKAHAEKTLLFKLTRAARENLLAPEGA